METFTPEKVVQTLRSVLPVQKGTIALHEPSLAGNEWTYVKECLDTGWVSYAGAYVGKFEHLLEEFTGVGHAVCVVNGTAALHVCCLLAGVEPDDEVLVPALTFVATANAVTYCGATPHFVDSEERTLGVDVRKLAEYLAAVSEIRRGQCYNRHTGRRIRAVVAVHVFGHPVALDPLAELCKRFNLVLIEDAAESLGSYYRGKHTGNWGALSSLSFNGNKTVTTGGGGAVLTNDPDLARRAKHLTTTARVSHPWKLSHDRIGFNYRLPSINAALGCAQMEQLPRFLQRKRALAEQYRRAFAGLAGLRFFTEPDSARSNYWLNALLLDETHAGERETLLQRTADSGIMTRPAWTLMHRLPMFEHCPRMDLTVAESIERRLINIPSSSVLGENYA
jgi:perosamine synthetase